jgi:CHAT domain-containing protein/exonuclease VII small subunit
MRIILHILTIGEHLGWWGNKDKTMNTESFDSQAIVAALQALVNATSEKEAMQIVHQYFDLLLSEQADNIIDKWIEKAKRQDEQKILKVLNVYRKALLMMRQKFQIKADIDRARGAQQQYLQTGNHSLLETAISIWENILHHREFANLPEIFRLMALNDSAVSFIYHYEMNGDVTDLDMALSLWQQAVSQASENSPELANYFSNIGAGLTNRYNRNGKVQDLEDSIVAYQKAVELSSKDSPELPMIFSNLGTGLRKRYSHSGKCQDLEDSIAAYQQAINLADDNSATLPGILNNLATSLKTRYSNQSGKQQDLEESLVIQQKAIKLTHKKNHKLPIYLNGLGSILTERYFYTGQLQDLEDSIAAHQQAIKLTSKNSPGLSIRLHNLGTTLRERYELNGNLQDLEESIIVFQQTIKLTPENSPELHIIFNSLGTGFRDRYIRRGNSQDLQNCIISYQKAVTLTPEKSPELPRNLTNLGIGLSNRYYKNDHLQDLEEGIRCFQQAVKLTSEDSPEFPARLNSLGVGLRDSYLRSGKLKDLEESVVAFQQSVKLTPENSPNLPIRLKNIGASLGDFYDFNGNLHYLVESINAYKKAIKIGLEVAVAQGLSAAHNWLNFSFTHENWQEVGLAYGYAYQASERLLQIQLLRSDKEDWLKETQGIAAKAVYAFTKNNKISQAIFAIEQGLARLLSESLTLNRTDLTTLKATENAYLYYDYQTAVQRWEWAQQHKPDELKPTRKNLDKVIDTIRQLQGYENFLMSASEADIQTATTINPLIYIVTTKFGGLALVVKSFLLQKGEEIIPVWLPELSEITLVEKLRGYFEAYYDRQKNQIKWEETLSNITHWLWQTAMYPIINALPPQSKVTLIPVGLLGLLPLHAAWTHDNTCKTGKRYALDELTIRYTPNARALKEANTLAQQVNADKLLAIDNPSNDLATSDPEVQSVQAMFTDSKVLSQENATQEAVLNALPDYNVVHFSCHGQTNFQQPLQSGLLMANGQEITLKELLKKHLKVRLATLSACETGLSGTTLPDEVVSLSSGMLQAGVAGVVASLWSVSEISTMMLMTRFYGLWQQKQLDPVDALQQAQQWVRDTTKQEKMVYFRQTIKGLSPDSNEVHLPKQTAKWLYYAIKDSTQDFSHPYHWAAFTYVGV